MSTRHSDQEPPDNDRRYLLTLDVCGPTIYAALAAGSACRFLYLLDARHDAIEVFARQKRSDGDRSIAVPEWGRVSVALAASGPGRHGGYRLVTGGGLNVIEQKDMRSVTGTFGLRFDRF
jgi:hypothetical protein